MRRLAIIDLKTGGQPIYNEDGKVAVVFNGEIYNCGELRTELQSKGHVFKTATDTEVIVHLYEEVGEGCPQRLEGMFAFAVADERTGKLLLARDHMGIKPLYHAAAPNGGLIFASEMKSLLLAPFIKRKLDPAALDLYLSYLYVPEPHSIFEGISKLPPGHLISHDWRAGRTAVKRYWELRKLPGPPAGEREEALRSLLARTVKSHLMSDVPLGVFLSGGLDSGAITALMAQAGADVKTFSIGYEGKGESSYNELDAAGLMARRFGTTHTEIRVAPKIAELLPKLAWHFDEPHADSSAIVTYLISQRAAASIKVALTGIGGDEIFGGYPRYMGARFHRLYRHLPGPLRRAALSGAERLAESGASRDWANWGKRFARGGLLDEFACYDSWVSAADTGLRSRLYSADWLGGRTLGPDLAGRRALHAGASSSDVVDQASYLDLMTYLPGDLLMMADKMSMASSLELRVPFCDRRLVEFMYSLPAGERAGWSGLKLLLRRVLRPLLPPEILAKRKQGFMVPLPLWLKGELAPLIDDLLAPSLIKRRGYFDPDAVAGLLAEHRSGARGRADLIWALMMFETWHRLYLDGEFKILSL
jgi:asparagine synthase (glutamine-hydrolysing)